MTAAPVVRAVQMTAGYNKVPIIVDLNLTVAPGEMVALLGANGAGKTTTMMALAGRVRVESGLLRCLGKRSAIVHCTDRVRSGLGLITERRCVFMGLTTRQNLRLGRGDIETALDHFPELANTLDTKVGLLSGGQQQMLAVARVLAAKPRLILADEVSMGLAPIIVKRLLVALRTASNRGAAVLIVEQHAKLALEFVDRAYVLQRGRLVFEGERETIRDRSEELSQFYL